MTPLPLRAANLSKLPAEVAAPSYDRTRVRPGIVHLGPGGFHRAHMARYTHDLLEADSTAFEWGIRVVGLRPADQRTHDVLTAQDHLYALVERDATTETATVVGSIIDSIHVQDSPDRLLAAIDSARIVSMTVTEHGYCLNAGTKRLDPGNLAIIADLATPRAPRSAIGIIVEGLRRRRDGQAPAFTALSCDNIQHNGDVLRGAVLDFARVIDADLADWIEGNARFPSTMVDRITPVTVPEDVSAFRATYAVDDASPVFCEPFRQWIIEDDFADGRPAWEKVGAQFVTDVSPYERMKLRLLNASHLAIAGTGRLAGYRLVDETMRDARFGTYMQALMDRETGPTLHPVPGVDIAAYKATLVERFANPRIKDMLDRINADAALNYLLDPLRDRLASGGSIDLLALGVAAWIKRANGADDLGAPIAFQHPLADEIKARALQGGRDPRAALSMTTLFGDLGESRPFVTTTAKWLALLYDQGAAASVELATAGG